MLHSKPFCVLLINPPFEGSYPSLPIGLAMLAAVLEQAGISVQVIDAWAERLNYAQLGQRIAAATPDLIGVTAMTPTFLQARRVVKEARKNAPDAMIVVGGPHPS
ncbi:MAG: cobalamin B12-binding domain-containing protein, partial [Dehalococcoidia bacterium]|nr:cobalamin B12-binding domain-containing protein [Dehalococcoidia bacterium]